MLPLVGSRDSILLVRDLMVRRTFQNDTAVQLLSSLPFSVREPSEQLLTDLEVVGNKVQTCYNDNLSSQVNHMVHVCAGAAVAARGHAGAPGSSSELCHAGEQGV